MWPMPFIGPNIQLEGAQTSFWVPQYPPQVHPCDSPVTGESLFTPFSSVHFEAETPNGMAESIMTMHLPFPPAPLPGGQRGGRGARTLVTSQDPNSLTGQQSPYWAKCSLVFENYNLESYFPIQPRYTTATSTGHVGRAIYGRVVIHGEEGITSEVYLASCSFCISPVFNRLEHKDAK